VLGETRTAGVRFARHGRRSLALDVPDANGRDVRWAVELDSSSSSERTRLFGKQGTLKPGTKVTVTAYQPKAGSNAAASIARDVAWAIDVAKAGRFVHGFSITMADGTKLGFGPGGVVPGKQ
jgi:hypothetical protein